MKARLKAFAGGFLYIFCNYFINSIPCWTIRKLLYRLCGMKIGKHSRIMMKTIVTIPWKITIGSNSYINEYCYIDGRGGIVIGDNVTVALRSMIITGTHDVHSSAFRYYAEPVIVEDNVWVAADSKILNGAILHKGCVVGAGGLVPPHAELQSNMLYAGAPVRLKGNRNHADLFMPPVWTTFFR